MTDAHDIPTDIDQLPPRKLLITGGTGFIGIPLVTMLSRSGCELTVLTRNKHRAAQEQPATPVQWLESLDELADDAHFDVLINLAGESLAEGRWTDAKKQRLFDSRRQTTIALYELAARLSHKPQYLINGSAVGFYGAQGDQKLNESSAANDSFSHRLCAEWETQADRLQEFGIQVCKLRLGVVLAPKGGAFEQIKQSFRYKLATQMGSGEHYFSWVHRHDLLRIFAFLLSREPEQRLVGPVNATAPAALTYGQLCRELAEHYHTLLKVPLPRALLRPLLGEMADELLLSGQRVEPQRLTQSGFHFRYPDLSTALPTLT